MVYLRCLGEVLGFRETNSVQIIPAAKAGSLRGRATMKCPNCLTENPASVTRCVCGYDLKELEAKRVAERIEKGVKLYSKKNIVGSTFFGGPLAAGYLLFRNFKGLGNDDAARNSLLIAIGVTALLFGVVRTEIWDQIPGY